MPSEYDIGLATPDDIPSILALQEPNLIERGGDLAVRQSEDWFRRAILDNSVVVARKSGEVVAYALGTSLAAKAHIPIIQAMLRVYPPPSDAYLYGPVCVAESERGKGLAAMLFKQLQIQMNGRPAMTFIRADNANSLRAHRKMGMKELGDFTAGGVAHIAFDYEGPKSA
jgi:predicted GNAT superfamily acetyltransferase